MSTVAFWMQNFVFGGTHHLRQRLCLFSGPPAFCAPHDYTAPAAASSAIIIIIIIYLRAERTSKGPISILWVPIDKCHAIWNRISYYYSSGKCGCFEEDSLVVGMAVLLSFDQKLDRAAHSFLVPAQSTEMHSYNGRQRLHVKGRKRKENESDVWLMCWRFWWMSLIGLRLHFIHIYSSTIDDVTAAHNFPSNMFIVGKLPIHPSIRRPSDRSHLFNA